MTTSPMIASLLKNRGSLIELVLAACILGLGVNFVAAATGTYFSDDPAAQFLLGVSLAALAISAIARRMFGANDFRREIDGFISIKRNSSRFIDVPGYKFSEETIKHINSLFAENEAPKKLWFADPLTNTFQINATTGAFETRQTAAGQILTEAAEYFLLSQLSTHLTDYFNQPQFDTEKLKELGRSDVPSLLLSNRFLDTFSRPMTDRPGFVDDVMEGTRSQAVWASGKGGLQYEKFDLMLPRGATVQRASTGHIEIMAPKFIMRLKAQVNGTNTVLPWDFERLFLKEPNHLDIQNYKVRVFLDVEFKPFALYSRSGWEYYSWLDSFASQLEEEISQDYFFEKIQWDVVLTLAKVSEGLSAKRSEELEPPSLQ